MTAQTANKVTVPVGSDGWNLTNHIKQSFETSGVIIEVADLTERGGLPALFPGGVLPNPTTIYRQDRARYETWNGSVWLSGFGTTYTPIWTGVTDFGTGGSLTGTYWVDGDRVTVRARARFGAAATMGTAAVYCPMPTGYPISGNQSGTLGTGFHVTTGGILRPLVVFAGSSTTASVWTPQIPVQTPGGGSYPAGNGDYMEIQVQYQTTGVS
jgi:hypothetical protein